MGSAALRHRECSVAAWAVLHCYTRGVALLHGWCRIGYTGGVALLHGQCRIATPEVWRCYMGGVALLHRGCSVASWAVSHATSAVERCFIDGVACHTRGGALLHRRCRMLHRRCSVAARVGVVRAHRGSNVATRCRSRAPDAHRKSSGVPHDRHKWQDEATETHCAPNVEC